MDGVILPKENDDLIVEIDKEIYERVALLGMRMGRDDVTEFINDMLYYQMIREQEEEEQGRRKKCSTI